MVHTQYLRDVFHLDKYKKTIEWVKQALKHFKFDAIAFRGTSGAAIAFPLSMELNIPLIHVRKDMGHSFHYVEGEVDSKNYIIIDDFVSSGKTIQEIVQRINKNHETLDKCGFPPRCSGVILYKEVPKRDKEKATEKIHKILPEVKIMFREFE